MRDRLIKTPKAIQHLREAGRRLALVLDEVEAAVEAGVSMRKLDEIASHAIARLGDTPAFLNYRPQGAPRSFPSVLCVAPNDVVVHGIPATSAIVLNEGDIIGIDTGLFHEGVIVDAGRTVAVGEVDDIAKRLIATTRGALEAGIAAALPGGYVGDIGAAIEAFVTPTGFSIVEDLCGHGVGYDVHEEPQVRNTGRRGTGMRLEPGMVLAIEPMVNEGTRNVIFERDGYTVRTRDGKRSAHFEHTVLITEHGNEVLTCAS